MHARIATLVLVSAFACADASAQGLAGRLKRLGDKTADKVEGKVPDPTAAKPKPEPKAPKTDDRKADDKKTDDKPAKPEAGQPSTGAAPSYKTYQNYDFVPGDTIVFEDDFRGDTDGEFPAHWKLRKGQAVVNRMQGEPVFALTEGNYVTVEPRMKTSNYLTDTFTVEFDFFPKDGSYYPMVFLTQDRETEANIQVGTEPSLGGIPEGLNGKYPGGDDAAFRNKWHHAAIVFKGGQLKVYEDQYRVLVVPDTGGLKPASLSFGGIGSEESPIVIRNVRVANGGGMTLIDKLTKDGRIVTHGITFDVNKATIKPESMGTIRQIVSLMKENAALKLEVGGHTDADGDAAKNLTLSQARADAVRTMLVDQGVDASRLTTKGYGATKPIGPNTTLEGKANNRRVEFAKIG